MTDMFTFTKAIAFMIINSSRKFKLENAKYIAIKSFRKGDGQQN